MAAEVSEFDAIWQAIGHLYAQPGVGRACLALQDDYGADVLALLYVAQLGRNGIGVSREDLARFDQACSAVRGPILAPLRSWRRTLADEAAAELVYAEAKLAELAIERLLLRVLMACPIAGERGYAHENLRCFAAHVEAPEDAVDLIAAAG